MIQQIVKTFNFLRIFKSLSYLTTMLKTVMIDLQPFMFFYVMIVFMFGMIFSVTSIGNVILPGGLHDKYYDKFPNHHDATKIVSYDPMVIIGPGLNLDVNELITSEEYLHMDMFMGLILGVMRTSIGDFDFSGLEYPNQKDSFLYFIVWFLCVLLSNIIFLNFIIAELSNIYEKVSSDLSAM